MDTKRSTMKEILNQLALTSAKAKNNSEALETYYSHTLLIMKSIMTRIQNQEAELNKLKQVKTKGKGNNSVVFAAFLAAIITFVGAWLCWLNHHHKQ